MMGDKFDRQLKYDRALKNSAMTLVKANVEQVKQDLSAKNIGGRLAGRMSAGVKDVSEQAAGAVSGKGPLLAVIAGAAAIWFARKPLLDLANDIASKVTAKPDQDSAETDPESKS